ncbi:MAG: family 20 glycosylhydrolase, partial [Micrococcales bacterium]|nr:family 20 glycosylhydrolase [Micrococcales bacterium]
MAMAPAGGAVTDDPVDRALAKELGLVPLPAQLERIGPGRFTLTEESKFIPNGNEAARIAELTAEPLRVATGFPLPVDMVTPSPGPHDIAFSISSSWSFDGVDAFDIEGDNEAYHLMARGVGLALRSPSGHGLWNGAQTLKQLFPVAMNAPRAVNAEWTIPEINIYDGPRFAWRGTMLDTARSWYNPDEVKKYIDAISEYKVSVLHLHLADDQGWRIEITNEGKEPGDPIDYTLLASVGGSTAMTELGMDGEAGHAGFFTQEDYQDIVAYAADRFVTVIPEIDLPGHTNSALHSIPQLNTEGSSWKAYHDTPGRWDPPGVEPVAGESTVAHNGTGIVGYSYLDPDSPLTFTFIRHVLTQIRDMTGGKYLGMGGDEVSSYTSRYGSARWTEVVTKISDIIHDLGMRAFGWSEIADGKLNPEDAIQFWSPSQSLVNVRASLTAGSKVVMSYGPVAYLDQKYWGRNPIGLNWACNSGNDWAGGATSCDFPNYYDWDPQLPPYASEAADRQFDPPLEDSEILGVEPPLWSETLRGISQVEFMAFPRVLSFAEIGWTPQELRTDEVQDFVDRIQVVGAKLTYRGVNFGDGRPKNTTNGTYPLTTDFTNGWAYDFVSVTPQDPVALDHDATVDLAIVAAPGTKLDSGETSISSMAEVYTTSTSVPLADRAVMRSISRVATTSPGGAFSVKIDWGDGTAPTDALFTTDQKRDAVHSPSTYTLQGTHAYVADGVYTVTLTGSDGAVRTSTIIAGDGEDLEIVVGAGTLSLAVPFNPVVNFGPVTISGGDQYVERFTNWALISDARGTNEGWTLTGTAQDFVGDRTGRRIMAANLGWAPYAQV